MDIVQCLFSFMHLLYSLTTYTNVLKPTLDPTKANNIHRYAFTFMEWGIIVGKFGRQLGKINSNNQ
jgi:hypothetical protein